MKIIISLTTSPKRILLLKETIYSIENQTIPCSKIIINIPSKFGRTNESYVIPYFIKNNPKIYINRTRKDLGPIMKLIPTIFLLDKLKIKKYIVITIDDDIKYLPNMIETYLNYVNNSNYKVLGISGFNFGNNNEIIPITGTQAVDVVEGYGGVMYHYSIFELEKWKNYLYTILSNKTCKYSDDLIISNYLDLENINRYLIDDINLNRELLWSSGNILEYGNEVDALHNGGYPLCLYNNSDRYLLALKFLKRKNLTNFLK
jgi:hypothetical protein